MQELPNSVLRRIYALEAAHRITQRDLEALIVAWNFVSVTDLLSQMFLVLDKLDSRTAAFVVSTVGRIVVFESALAERRLGLSTLTLNDASVEAISRRFSLTFFQQSQETRQRLEEIVTRGWQRGMSLSSQRALTKAVIDEGITGLIRADGSRLSVESTGKALVRTRVNQLQAEVQLQRYREAEVERVEFVAGGECHFKGTGGTCTGLNGRQWPIDEIPDWAQIPRHLFSNSRWLPVVA